MDAVPTRLDEALRYAVSRIEKDPRDVDAVGRYLGWYGHIPDAKHQPSQPIDLAREQAAANRALERLRQDGFIPNVVEGSLRLIEQSLPLLEMEACEALMKSRLCFIRLSCEALLAAAQCFRPEPSFEIVKPWHPHRAGETRNCYRFNSADLSRTRSHAILRLRQYDAASLRFAGNPWAQCQRTLYRGSRSHGRTL